MLFRSEDEKEDIKTFQRRLLNTQTPETFAKTFEVNVSAVYFTTVAFLELLHKGNLNRKSHDDPTSQVIIMSSIGGFRTDAGLSSFSYSASKAAVTHLGKLFANKFKKWDIRSNIVAPGLYPSGKRFYHFRGYFDILTVCRTHLRFSYYSRKGTGPRGCSIETIRSNGRHWRTGIIPC